MVGKELEALPGFLISIADSAQGQGLLAIGDLDDLIGGDTRCPVHRAALNDPETGVALEASDQEDVGFTELPEPGVVDIAPVKDHDRPLGQFEQLGDVDLMAFGFGDGDHSREIAVMVYDRVHLDAALGCSELGPGEQGQAQVDDRCVKAEQFVFKRKFVFWRLSKTPCVEFAEQGLEKGVRALVIGVGKGGPGHRFHAKMVESVGGGVHAHDPVPQAFASGQLGVQQVDEMAPLRKCPR